MGLGGVYLVVSLTVGSAGDFGAYLPANYWSAAVLVGMVFAVPVRAAAPTESRRRSPLPIEWVAIVLSLGCVASGIELWRAARVDRLTHRSRWN